MLNSKAILALCWVALLFVGCSNSSQVHKTQSIEQISNDVYAKLDSAVAPVFYNCVNFAANGTEPNPANFMSSGYKKGNLLGVLTYRLDAEDTTFAFIKSGQKCTFTSTEFFGMYLMAGWVRKRLEDQGWQKFKGSNKYQSLYKKGSLTILMSGFQSNGQSQIVLRKG